MEELLKRSFRPEFLNRLDEIVFYKPLTRENITGIIDLLVKDLNRRLEPQELSVRLTPEAKEEIIDRSYDPPSAPGPCVGTSSTRWRPSSPGSSSPGM